MDEHPLMAVTARAASSILEEMSGIIAAAQKALLCGEIQQIETTLLQQRALCQELELCLREQSPKDKQSSSSAKQVARQNRVFAAVLRRMRSNLEILRKADRMKSLLYKVPGAQEPPS